MKGARFLLTLTTLVLASGILPSPAQSEFGRQVRLDGLSRGMSSAEVLRQYGPPNDRQELEAKRRDIWKYGQVSVVFEQGRVLSWTMPAAAVSAEAPLQQASAVINQRHPRTKLDDGTVSEILNELVGYGSPGSPDDSIRQGNQYGQIPPPPGSVVNNMNAELP